MSDFFDYDPDGPLSRDALDSTLRAVQDRLDLLVVLEKRYGARMSPAGARWRTACFLPSQVKMFAGSCAEQDAGSNRGATPRNLWVSEGELTRVWRCHSCQRRGDVVDLIEHADGALRNDGQMLSLSAVRIAAKLAGVAYVLDGCKPRESDVPSDLVDVSAPRRAPTVEVRRVPFASARSLNSRSASHWGKLLRGGPGRRAREELARRGVTPEQAKRYRIGYAADSWRDLCTELPKKGIDDAIALGLLGRTRHGKLYDRQRDRLVFPYCDPAESTGKVAAITGFAGRRMGEDADGRSPKWLNSVNVPGVWEKKGALIGMYQALERVLETGRVALSEGAWEVLAFDRIGAACVGLVSAALTQEHVAVLASRLKATHVVLAFDGDETGRSATIAAAVELLKYGYLFADISAVDCADGTDPAELSTAELTSQWNEPASVLEFCRAHPDAGKPHARTQLLKTLSPTDAAELRTIWGLPAQAVQEHAELDNKKPAQRFAALLAADPATALLFARQDVLELLASDTLAQAHVTGLTFGEHSAELADLPSPLRRVWMSCRLSSLSEQIAKNEEADPMLTGGSTDAWRAWFKRGEALQAEREQLRKTLDET